jgi:hypothetical protein
LNQGVCARRIVAQPGLVLVAWLAVHGGASGQTFPQAATLTAVGSPVIHVGAPGLPGLEPVTTGIGPGGGNGTRLLWTSEAPHRIEVRRHPESAPMPAGLRLELSLGASGFVEVPVTGEWVTLREWMSGGTENDEILSYGIVLDPLDAVVATPSRMIELEFRIIAIDVAQER